MNIPIFLHQSKQKPSHTLDARIVPLETLKHLHFGYGMIEAPEKLSESAPYIRKTYQFAAVHSDIEAEKSAKYVEIFTEAFGEGQQEGPHWYWLLDPLTEEEEPPKKETEITNSVPYSSEGEPQQEAVSCQNPQTAVEALLDGDISEEDQAQLDSCGDALGKYCVQRSKNNSITVLEALQCLDILEQYHSSDNQYAFMHLLRHKNDEVKISVAKKLITLPKSRSVLSKQRVEQLAQNESEEIQKAFQELVSNQ